MRAGARCRVQGLKASPEWNGKEVKVEGTELERYKCKLETGRMLRLKPHNLVERTTCSQCGSQKDSLKNCSKCGVAAYCSKDCQVCCPTPLVPGAIF